MNLFPVRSLALLLSVMVTSAATFAESLSVIYPRDMGRAKENSYDYQLLQLALDKSGVDYELSLTDVEMNEERARRTIAAGSDEVTVMSAGTRKEFEEQLTAIYIPLYGGLIGNRIFIVHRDNVRAFSKVKNLDDLKSFVAGQGPTWPDVDVFTQAKLPVDTAEYPVLFKLTELKRIDYFPRGANEPFAELERFNEDYPSLVVEPNVLLVYPFALYFFVAHENQALHDAIHLGLTRAHEDGSFREFFKNHPVTKKMLEQAQLGSRLRLTLENPTMSERTLAIPSEYWYDASWH